MEILVCGMTENQGGIEVYLANLVKTLNPESIRLSFVKEKPQIAYNELLQEKGCPIYEISWRRKHPIRHMVELGRLLKAHDEIGLLYVNAMSSAILPSVLAGKLAGKKVLVHSRNNQTKNMLVHNIVKPVLNLFVDERFACSELAAKFLFGRRHCEVISNGIDFSRFVYDKEKRDKLREELFPNENPYVIGFVGNLTYQKNVLLLIDIYVTFLKKHENARLVIVGDGELRDEVRQSILAYEIEDKVILAGKQSNPQDYYMAFDLFLFPSRYEGFGNVLIEAQLAGLPVVCSKDVIPISTKISNDITYVSLNDSLVTWRKAMEKFLNKPRKAFESSTGEEKKYELHQAVAHIETLLLNINQKSS